MTLLDYRNNVHSSECEDYREAVGHTDRLLPGSNMSALAVTSLWLNPTIHIQSLLSPYSKKISTSYYEIFAKFSIIFWCTKFIFPHKDQYTFSTQYLL